MKRVKGGLGTERLLNMFLIKFSPQNFRLKPWKFSFIQCIEFPWGAAESEGPIRRSSLLIRLDYKVHVDPKYKAILCMYQYKLRRL